MAFLRASFVSLPASACSAMRSDPLLPTSKPGARRSALRKPGTRRCVERSQACRPCPVCAVAAPDNPMGSQAKPQVALLSTRHFRKVPGGSWRFEGVTRYEERLPYYVSEAVHRLDEGGMTKSPDIFLVPGDKVFQNGEISQKPQLCLLNAKGWPLQWQDMTNLDDADKEALRERLGLREDTQDVVLFIHGFNTDYTGAVGSAQEIAAAFKGEAAGKVAVLAYDWASTSRGHIAPAGLFRPGGTLPSIVTGYAVDSETARVSVRQLEWLLLAVTSIPSVRNVHLLAHSMGSRVLSYAIDRFLAGCIDRRDGGKMVDDRPKKIGLCIFKQADLDPINLAETLARIEDWWRITGTSDLELWKNRNFDPVVLAHPHDVYLKLSEVLHGGMRRVGQYTKDRLWNILRPDENQTTRDVYQRLVGSEEDAEDLYQWLSALLGELNENDSPGPAMAVRKVKEMIDKKWDDNKLNALLDGEEGKALKQGAMQLRVFLAEETSSFEPTGASGILRNARSFPNRGWSGHSYFGDPVFQDYLARAIAAYNQGYGPLMVDPLGSYLDLAVAMWRMKQLWKCKPDVLGKHKPVVPAVDMNQLKNLMELITPLQNLGRQGAGYGGSCMSAGDKSEVLEGWGKDQPACWDSSTFYQKLEDAAYGGWQDEGDAENWNILASPEPESEVQGWVQ